MEEYEEGVDAAMKDATTKLEKDQLTLFGVTVNYALFYETGIMWVTIVFAFLQQVYSSD